jgi:hypothetical protein
VTSILFLRYLSVVGLCGGKIFDVSWFPLSFECWDCTYFVVGNKNVLSHLLIQCSYTILQHVDPLLSYDSVNSGGGNSGSAIIVCGPELCV